MNYYNDNNPKACAALRQLIKDGHIPAGHVDERSITDVAPEDLKGFIQCHFFAGVGGWVRALQLAGWPTDRPVWTGSYPCQPFSAAGKGKGGSDDRHLWPVGLALKRQCRPATFYGEQVASAISHGWVDRVFTDLEGQGYACAAAILPAASVNAPHKRDRLWYVAHSTIDGNCRTQGNFYKEERRQVDGVLQRPICTGEPCDLADPKLRGRDSRFTGDGRAEESARGESGEISDRHCHVADSLSLRGRSGDGQRQDAEHANAPGEERGAGFWDDHEWIMCGDGKARRVPAASTGIRILAHGLPERVGLIHAGGNAIVPEVAARFIQATM